MKPKSFLPPKEQLYELYINQSISSGTLAKLYGVRPETVLKKLHEYGIPISKRAARFHSFYSYYRDKAEARGYCFELTEDQFFQLISSDCHYCGNSPNKREKHDKFRSVIRNDIDRVDNSQGYTVENSRSCCKTCNFMKHSMPEEVFIAHVLQVAAHITRTQGDLAGVYSPY